MDSDSSDNDSDSHSTISRKEKIDSIVQLTNIMDRRNAVEDMIVKYKLARVQSSALINNTYNYVAEMYRQAVMGLVRGKHSRYIVKFNFNEFERGNTLVSIKETNSR